MLYVTNLLKLQEMNQLNHVDEFHKALADYKLSHTAIKTLSEVRLLLMVAPSASGRNTIIRELVKTDRYHFIVSDTTRNPRINNGVPEENGREYWFRTEEEVLKEIKKGEFLEAAVIHNQQVSGISVRELESARKDGKVAITDIEIVGAANIHRAKPDTDILFMVPPSFDIWLERIHSRGTMPEDELIRRLESAEEELSTALRSDYYRFVLNDTVEGTTAEIDRFASTGYYDPFKEQLSKEVAQNLYKRVKKYLAVWRQEHSLDSK